MCVFSLFLLFEVYRVVRSYYAKVYQVYVFLAVGLNILVLPGCVYTVGCNAGPPFFFVFFGELSSGLKNKIEADVLNRYVMRR